MSFLPPAQLLDPQINVKEIKHQLDAFFLYQKDAFLNDISRVEDYIFARADYMDALLARLWRFFGFDQWPDLTLVAVGGYGRRELHPLSDIDILLLSKQSATAKLQEKVSAFITFLWDLKLEVGHAVRTIEECAEIGKDDLTVATNLQEARFITGNHDHFHRLKLMVLADSFWPSETFYRAKIAEQRERHSRYHDTSYNLEPDIKSTPGGLRDIHTLSWIARRHFGATSLLEMSKYGFLTDAEYRELGECQTFLWQVRFALHLELKRYDNRLTFNHQAQVAEHLGYTDGGNRAVETMMKTFYRTLGLVTELNKMLLKIFDQAILSDGNHEAMIPLDEDFYRQGRWVETDKPALFQSRPESILTLFLHIANDSSLEGIGPATLRQLRTARRRINRYLHTIEEARELFMALMRHPNILVRALKLMHRYGVISAYIPQWNQIVGQMQFDLFHVYTVDEHSIRVLNHIHCFSDLNNHEKHPICCEIYPKIIKKELLIIAAIFHDIGKGRGGDHSEIGAVEAYEFCIEHGLSRPEAKLVSWLVLNHLLMSVTAQRRDIYDPEVITEFAKVVRDEEHLDYLVCLTVADICATNPDLWNSWKRTLLAELYYSTQRALRRGLENPVDVRDRIRHNQQLASALLRKAGYSQQVISTLWQRFKADYFLRHTHQQIAWQSDNILSVNKDSVNKAPAITDFARDDSRPHVWISERSTRGGSEMFVYTKDQPALFATVVAELDRRNLNVHDAIIMTTKDGFVLDTFMILDQNGEAIDIERHPHLIDVIESALKRGFDSSVRPKRTPQKLKHFRVKTRVDFLPTRGKKHTLMEFVALDTPGLLAKVGAIFSQQGLRLHGAKISTLGEKAEDLFILTNAQGAKLSDQEQIELQQQLLAQIVEEVTDK